MNALLRVRFSGMLLVSLVLTGCAASLQDVKVAKVQLCEQGQCATLGEGLTTEKFLARLYAFLARNINRDAELTEVDASSHVETGSSIKYYTQGGPLPFFSSISSIKFTDLSYLDRERQEVRFKLKPWASFLGVPILCAEGDGSIRVNTAQDVQLETSSLCTWLVNPVNWQMKVKIERIDLDRSFILGHYSVGHAGPTSVGKGSGYQAATFKRSFAADTADPPALNQRQKPLESPEDRPGLPHLTYRTVFTDANHDGVLDGGERISLTVEVSNQGKAAAQNVSVALAGAPYLVNALGAKRDLGVIAPQETRQAQFEAVLPQNLPSDSAELKVELYDGGIRTTETRVIRLAARRGQRVETVQVISQPPQLQFSLELKDQNNNKVLEGGEEVTLLAEISNRGQGAAEDVQLQLSGTRSLINLFGARQPVGDLPPGGTKRVEMKGVLPQSVSSESAELKVELTEKRGFAPTESRILRVATRGRERKEVVEVISELSVDDIPAKVRGHVNRDDLAVVIGIGSYRESAIPPVKYARRDAEVVAKYLEHLGGIPKENVALLTDANATKSDIEAFLGDWLPRRVTPKSRVFVYYAGHGAPEPAGRGAYLVPYEGHPDFASKLIPLTRFYDALNRLPAKEVVVFLDSCFSGAQGRSVAQQGIRPIIMVDERQLAVPDKPVVFAAASGSEVTSDLDAARHGLFTYYLLKGLRGEADRNGSGTVTLEELYTFVSEHVKQTAARDLNRIQTPLLLPGGAGGKSAMELVRTR